MRWLAWDIGEAIDRHLQYSDGHCCQGAEFLQLVQLQLLDNLPWKYSQDDVHDAGVCYENVSLEESDLRLLIKS